MAALKRGCLESRSLNSADVTAFQTAQIAPLLTIPNSPPRISTQ
jgi:hypothetical protein